MATADGEVFAKGLCRVSSRNLERMKGRRTEDLADGDPVEVNLNSAMYGSPDEIARKLEALRDAGAGYLLINGGGSGGGERGRQSLRRFAKEVMPAFAAA